MGLRVLLIEDNEQNRYLLTFLLERSGHQVVSANDGLAGIRQAQKETPDVILLDIQLPTMHGYDVAAGLRNIPALVQVPIIRSPRMRCPVTGKRRWRPAATTTLKNQSIRKRLWLRSNGLCRSSARELCPGG